jgi:putative endonuclease
MEGYTYVYILRSKTDPNRHYTGLTTDLRRRLQEHNSGNVNHTAELKPWVVKTAIAFEDATRARAFEKFLKSGSGQTFVRERL